MSVSNNFRFAFFVVVMFVMAGCRTTQQGYQNVAIVNPRIAYDDSTLTKSTLPLMMPYNRIIDPAGAVIRYGDLDLENHTLDLKKIPNTKLLVVQDRYGIVVLDTEKQKILDRWAYKQVVDYTGFTSTYSGIQVFQKNGQTRFFGVLLIRVKRPLL